MPGIVIKDIHVLQCDEADPRDLVDLHIDEDGCISLIGEDLPPGDAKIIDGGEGYASPGWIDLHTHVYYGVCDIAIPPQEAGPATGVHVVVDAGSAGEANLLGFRKYVAGSCDFPVFAYLNVGSIGLVKCNRVSELAGVESLDVDSILERVAAHRDLIRGVKVRASHVILRDWGTTPVRMAKKIAQLAQLPLVVHIGEPPPLLEEILPILSEGDLITHCYHGKAGGSLGEDAQLRRLMKGLIVVFCWMWATGQLVSVSKLQRWLWRRESCPSALVPIFTFKM